MCCTSIFYFISTLGYYNFEHKAPDIFINNRQLELVAECQRYYCLAHASFVSGVLLFGNYRKKQEYRIIGEISNLLLKSAFILFPVSLLFLKVPGLSQFYFQFSALSFIAGTLALAFAIPKKKFVNTLASAVLYAFNFYLALTSGFKEPIIISVLVLGVFLYPSYKKAVTIIFVPLLFSLFIILPAYNRAFRGAAWTGDTDADEASKIAIDNALNSSDEESDWGFLVYRLSEIDMFTVFVSNTPSTNGYYGWDLLKQSAVAIVPRIFWPSKPITEELIMERVYAAGVVSRFSSVSAKPTFVVDAYLSGGTISIFLCLLAYGATAQLISVYAERLFGGYTFGTALIYSGLFQIMWRGLSFEFLINSVFWSFFSMLAIHRILTYTKIIVKIR
jgi:hypothetical protein